MRAGKFANRGRVELIERCPNRVARLVAVCTCWRDQAISVHVSVQQYRVVAGYLYTRVCQAECRIRIVQGDWPQHQRLRLCRSFNSWPRGTRSSFFGAQPRNQLRQKGPLLLRAQDRRLQSSGIERSKVHGELRRTRANAVRGQGKGGRPFHRPVGEYDWIPPALSIA